VFSPYYAWSRARGGAADPLDHCALNVALYGRGGKRWAMTERGRRGLERDAASLRIGPSALAWDGRGLSIRIDEVAVPLPSRIRGRVRLEPGVRNDEEFTLDPAGVHRWWPIAPCARVEVALERPALSWSGHAYLDSNRGDAPLEAGFRRWHWSRSALPDGSTVVLYDVDRRDGEALSLALRFAPGGGHRAVPPPPRLALPATLWRVPRQTRGEGGAARVLETLEDTPFYARSLVSTRHGGGQVTGVHESLSLDRFRRAWVQLLLPFRMPRRPR